jgi:hypothetical protein
MDFKLQLILSTVLGGTTNEIAHTAAIGTTLVESVCCLATCDPRSSRAEQVSSLCAQIFKRGSV